MPAITPEMRRVVSEQKLGYVATVSADGRPNLSPKGTLAVWDEDHLVFADLASPRTVANLRDRPHVEINVVDPFVRKGFRFRGTASVLDPGPAAEPYLRFFERHGVQRARERIRAVVLIRVEQALRLVSPLYDAPPPAPAEQEVRRRWKEYYRRLDAGETDLPDPA
ncbi:MAG TPA: pyridoxamine 5'-phosphate oxidase family protein [Thermoplasmata archaeon]|nr:pyridoxamine 5'-phosphate oxidase family protein [Thermoplasmata archaeon]